MRDRTVGLLVSVELLMSLGFGATATTLGWQGYSRAHDPLVLGLIGLAEFIPAVVLALPAGHAADSHDRRRVTALGLAVVVAAAVALAIDAGRGDTAVWPLYVLAFVIGIGNAYSAPAVGPLLAAGVSQAMLARAVAVLMSVMQAAMIAGPAVAGLLQVVGPPVPYAFAAVCAVLAMVMVMLVPKAIGRAHVAEQEASLSDALAGVRFIFDTPALLGAISLDLMAVLFGGATALLPVFSQTILHVGAFGNGLLRAAPGIGAVVVGSVLSRRPHAAGGGGAVRRLHDRVRVLDQLRAVDGRAGRPGRRRHGVDVDPRHAGAAADRARAAGPGGGGGARLHRRLQRDGRLRVGRRGGADRRGAGRGAGRRRLDRGGPGLGLEVPGAAPHRPVRGHRHAGRAAGGRTATGGRGAAGGCVA